MNPPVSLLICTRDRRALLALVLADLAAQNYAGAIEIVVVEETDSPLPPPAVRYLPHPLKNLGIAYARNLALAAASHTLIVYVDDDCRMAPDWLEKLLAPFADAAVLGVQGGVTVPQESNAVGWAETLLGFPGGGLARIHAATGQWQPTIEVSTLNAAYRKEAVEAAGGFSMQARLGGEDYLLAKRVAAQGKLLFVPEAGVTHLPRGRLPAIWHWFVRRGMAEVALLRAGLAPAGYRTHILRASFMLKLLALLPVALLLGCPWLLLLLPAAMALRLWHQLAWARQRTDVPKSAIWLAPLVKLTMDLAADFGRLRAMLERR